MNSFAAENAYRRGNGAAEVPVGQLIVLLSMLVAGGALLLLTIAQAALPTVLLFFAVCIVGLVLCRHVADKLGDPALRVLGYLWLAKLALTLFLLYAGWMPQLDEQSSLAWGYDPQRYYSQAKELIDNNWSPDFLSLNYVGVIYYYGAIFRFLGYNPVTPALVNAFITLIATLYLVKVGYEIKRCREPGDWTLALALLLPEIVWFDVLTSRETLVAALLLATTLTAGRYLTRRNKSPSLLTVAIVSLPALLGIAAVRTSMVAAALASLLLMLLLIRPKHGSQLFPKVVLTAAATLVLLAGLGMSTYLGGYEFDLSDAIGGATSATGNVAQSADVEWSDNSIGMLLMPEGIAQSILYLVPRMVLYLCAPLPNIWVSASDLATGSWAAWQKLSITLSSVINVLAIPFALASLVQSVRQRNEDAGPLVFHIAYWTTFAAIAGGNLIVQERYRVMAAPLLWGCAWLGARTCPKHVVVSVSQLWYGFLVAGALFYLGYKGV